MADSPESSPTDGSAGFVPEPPLSSVSDALTPRILACAVLLGSGVCLANMYFGLQAGMVNSMPMQSALLGFGLFRSMRHHLPKPLSPMETTLIEIIAGALGLAPFTAGFTSFIPALQFLATSEDQISLRLSTGQLFLWPLAICGIGIIAAAPFRTLFILRERLRYPSATATGTLIGVLFRQESIITRANIIDSGTAQSQSAEHIPSREPADSDTEQEGSPTALPPHTDGFHQESLNFAIKSLLYSLASSALFVSITHPQLKHSNVYENQGLISFFLPVLRRVPIFGTAAAKTWLWAFDLSPAYFGYGIIIGPTVNAYILLGAVIGWGVLSPIAKQNGWAPGPVDDWDSGSRGWILWIGMGLILGDTVVGLGWILVKPMVSTVMKQKQRREQLGRSLDGEEAEHVPLFDDIQDDDSYRLQERDASDHSIDDDWSSQSLVVSTVLIRAGLLVLLLYLVSLFIAFRELVSTLSTLIAVVIVPLAGFISMRSLGETDNGASLAVGMFAISVHARNHITEV